MNKKILAFLFLPIFLITLGFPSIKNSFENEKLFENEEFQIFSSYFNNQTIYYEGAVFSNENMTLLVTTGIYNGDISKIDSITFSYDIKSKNDESYHNVSFNLSKDIFKVKKIEEDTYFYGELPIYYNHSKNIEFLRFDGDYFILNPTLTINNSDGTSQITTYEQDYEIEPGWTIYDNGDQSYPKIVDSSIKINGNAQIIYSDGDNFNFYDYSSFSLYHHVEYYDLYDVNNENLLILDNFKLTPVSSAKKITNGQGEGLYKQEFEFSSSEAKMPRNYGYKEENNSVFMILNNDYKKISYEYITEEKINYVPPTVYEDNIKNYSLTYNEFYEGANYLVLDIDLIKRNISNTISYKEFTKNIKMRFDWNIYLNVEDPYGIHKEWDDEYVTYEAQEVSEINSSLLETPGLYYQDSDIETINDNELNYKYYLVLPDENYWNYQEGEEYSNEMIFNDFGVYFPYDLDYSDKNGYTYYYSIEPNYDISDSFVVS